MTWLIASFSWETSFVVTGLLGIIWAVFWVIFYRDPEKHWSVTPEQLQRLQAERGTKQAAGPKIPWGSLFRYRTIWGMMIGFFCLNFVIYFFITWFPTYLVQARGFSLAQLGTLGLLPGLVSIPCGWLGGFTSDALYRHGWSSTAARKTCLVGGMLVSSVITLSAFAPSVYVALLCFAIAYGSLAFTAASIWSLPGDVAPTPAHVASIGGIQNFASNLAGIVTTTFTGLMLTITSGSFIVPLTVAGGFCVLGAAVYLFMVGKIEPLPALPGRVQATPPARGFTPFRRPSHDHVGKSRRSGSGPERKMTAEPVSVDRAEEVLSEQMAWLPQGEPLQSVADDRTVSAGGGRSVAGDQSFSGRATSSKYRRGLASRAWRHRDGAPPFRRNPARRPTGTRKNCAPGSQRSW